MRYLCHAIAAALCASAAPAALSLDIALTNDDGWQAPGIQAVYQVLAAQGHHVILAAPGDNQSASGTAMSTGPLRVRRESSGKYSVWACHDAECQAQEGARPATCGLVAIDLVRRGAPGGKVDLLVSGINAGANLSEVNVMSGTVGAARVAAIPLFDAGVPAIAISTDEPATCQKEATCVRAHYENVANYLARLIGQLARERDRQRQARLLPDDMILNVNYPGSEPRGIRVATLGRDLVLRGRPSRVQLDCTRCMALADGESVLTGLQFQPKPELNDRMNSDSAMHLDGYITLTPISTRNSPPGGRAWRWLERLK